MPEKKEREEPRFLASELLPKEAGLLKTKANDEVEAEDPDETQAKNIIQENLKKSGWTFGDAEDFLNATPGEIESNLNKLGTKRKTDINNS